MKVVICGGGVIGCSIAYYLAKKGVRSVLVERCDLACAASGKAGMRFTNVVHPNVVHGPVDNFG